MHSRVGGVLFDWRGTLVCDMEDSVWLHAAASRMGRELDPSSFHALSGNLAAAAARPEFAERLAVADCSAAAHRETYLELFRAAGMDDALARELYELDFDPSFHPFFPDVASVLASLKKRGVAVAVVSDIHFDLRPEFAAEDIDRFVDTYVLSFEQGVQKPDSAIFELALELLDIEPHEALMVGDNVRRDGGAILAGIRTFLLPQLRECRPRGLDAVLRIAG